MTPIVYYSDELLRPISPDQPCGQDLSYDLLFREIREARRFDDQTPNWAFVAERCLDALRHRTKDLTLIAFLTEAAVHLDGFRGLSECLHLARETLVQYWDSDLIPRIEDGDMEYRAGAFGLFNDRIADAMTQVAITAGPRYSFSRRNQALTMGTEASIEKTGGDRRETLDGYRRQGWITMDAWDAAIADTPRDHLEEIFLAFEEARNQFVALSTVLDRKFGDAAPPLGHARGTFEAIGGVLELIVKAKRERQPVPATAEKSVQTNASLPNQCPAISSPWNADLPVGSSESWADAEALIRAGEVDRALNRMATLAASEASGRARFLRKLMLVDVCLAAGRHRMAKTILEELKAQIIEYKLERWESSALIGAVWSRLYRIYRKSEMSNEQDQAGELYSQLCRLDPWQAYLHCED